MSRVQLWSCGGGRQSAGIAALIVEGQLPKPDHVCMVALEWERRATFRYVCDYIRPAMRSLSIPFTFVSRKKYATKGFWGGEDGKTFLPPAFTNQSGKPSKLDEFCSGEWKREVVMRWAAEQPGWKKRGVDSWTGISFDERHRRRAPRKQWIQPAYPLLDVRPTYLAGCSEAVERAGWPCAPRSRCEHCPNQSDREYAELTPDELERACLVDEHLRSVDPNAFLHKSLIPLRLVTFNVADDNGGLFGGCTSGMCF